MTFGRKIGANHPALLARAVPLGILLVLVACRWRSFFHTPEFSVDEAQTIAGAITLRHSPFYWRSVDGTTHGPLNDFVLLLPLLWGGRIDFATARFVGTLLGAGSLACFWSGARRIWGETVAGVAVLPPLAFLALGTFWDFVDYGSEDLPIFLAAAGWALTVRAVRVGPASGRQAAGAWGLAGFILGLVPFAKLQGIPPAAVLALLGLAAAARWRARTALIAFASGLALPAAGCALYLTASGLWRDFWQSYILNNLRYATQTKMFTLTEMIRRLGGWIGQVEGVEPLLLGGAAFIGLAALGSGAFSRTAWRNIAVSACLLLAAVYAAIAPGRIFHHYLLFLILPWSGFCAAWLAALLERPGTAGSAVRARIAVAAFLIFGLVPQAAARLDRPDPFRNDSGAYPAPLSPVSALILRYAYPGEPLGIWGYMPRYYVETGLPQATRDGQNERQILPQPQSGYYRSRYLADLTASFPPVFLDAVGPNSFWLENRTRYGHETWPALAQWIERNYRLIADTDGIRVYARRDRASGRNAAATK